MNLQQLRIIRETIRQQYNLTNAAQALHASQSGLSKHILELEDELGVRLFIRRGKRLVGLTPEGEQIWPIIERLNFDLDNLQQQAADLAQDTHGTLSIATTHTQARYILPQVIESFRQQFPAIQLKLHQASPDEIAQMLKRGQADIGIATESLTHFSELHCEPFYQWRHCLVTLPGHPLQHCQPITLAALADFPLITYHDGFTGRGQIDQVFLEANIAPHIVLTALDADVIKTYAQSGLGVGIIASMAKSADDGLISYPIDFFGTHTTWIAHHRQNQLRHFGQFFIKLCHLKMPLEVVITA